MGGFFSSNNVNSNNLNNNLNSSSIPKITEQDRAILSIKTQRDSLKQYQKKCEKIMEREKQIAKELIKNGKKQKALLALKKKKYQKNLLEKAEIQLNTLQELIDTIEFKQVELKFLEGLTQGKDLLKELNNQMKIEQVEQLLEENDEAISYQKELDELLTNSLSNVDDEQIELELRELEQTDVIDQLVQLPVVKTTIQDKLENNNQIKIQNVKQLDCLIEKTDVNYKDNEDEPLSEHSSDDELIDDNDNNEDEQQKSSKKELIAAI
eukprot:TRINITY_DN7424_c1_g1_i1.p1 TRINITY_DN7424_c1_g1~~TRINITY_DN7424_c1_g1_i1.p1  ORF type:complete len:266 (-),score=138.04 TRINITY_DN7424_c1_g1_i1:4-801(-)